MIFNDIPELRFPWQIKEIERTRTHLRNESHVGPAGEIRWNSNDTVVPLDVFSSAYVTPPASQKAERDRQVEVDVAAYRERMKNHVPSGEEMFEMRAAFGAGAKVVNVITGQTIQL